MLNNSDPNVLLTANRPKTPPRHSINDELKFIQQTAATYPTTERGRARQLCGESMDWKVWLHKYLEGLSLRHTGFGLKGLPLPSWQREKLASYVHKLLMSPVRPSPVYTEQELS